MYYKKLLEKGAKAIKPLEWHPDREKASGRMWGGHGELELNDMLFIFEMWHHGGDAMTEDQAMDAISLKSIRVDGKYYDVHWYTIMTVDAIYLHTTGWFYDKKLGEAIKGMQTNYNFDRSAGIDEAKLIALGFIKLDI